MKVLKLTLSFVLGIFVFVSLLVTWVPAIAKTDGCATVSVSAHPITVIHVTKKTPTAILKLLSNRSTGFSWFLVRYNHHLVVPVSAKYYPPKKAIPGASGYEIWTFKIKRSAFIVPQMTTIIMRYSRPWTRKGSKRKKIVLVAQVSRIKSDVQRMRTQ